jgi:succinate dehydrogenase / fumarate reductase, cytochrome b subunit
MKIIKNLLGSSVGHKLILAVTGGLLFLFVLMHLAGNLQFYLGPAAINAYGHMFQEAENLRWPIRLALLFTVGLHAWTATRLTIANRRARPIGYDGNPPPIAASYASRTMLMTGLVVASFLIYHLLHFTVRVPVVNLTGQDFSGLTESLRGGPERHDIFKMMVLGFRQWPVSLFYLIGVGLLSFHLSNGIRAVFQSLGLKNGKWDPMVNRVAPVIAWLIFLGYASIPVSVLLGFGKEIVR